MNRNLIDKYKSFDLYLNDNKEEICRKIKQLCEKYAINIIISVDKKGSDIIKFLSPGGAIEVNEYIDMKLDDFSIFNNKNILIFDDTARTGNTLKNVKESLLRKVKKAVKGQNINCNFIFYCLAICKDKETIKEKLGDKFFSFEENSLEYADYYDFCIKEAQYLQQKYMVTSSDLPVFEGYLNNIDSLMKALDRYSNSLRHEKVEVYIGNKLINTELIILKDNKLKKIFGDFIVAFLCKIRYEYLKEIKKYRVVMTPWALTASINYEKLKELYMLMFPEDKIDTNEDSSDEAIRMYKRVNFFISYYIGYVLKRLLWINAIEIEYTNNGFNQFGYEVNAHVKNTIDDSNFDIYEYLKDFSYSENTVDNTLKNYSYSKLNNYLYEKIIESEKKDGYDDRFIKVELLKKFIIVQT